VIYRLRKFENSPFKWKPTRILVEMLMILKDYKYMLKVKIETEIFQKI
jgi:hypothetical protein